MKLYTEEQVREMLLQDNIFDIDDILDSETPIELPSDEEIREASDEFYDNNGADIYFIQGAKWMRDKILNK